MACFAIGYSYGVNYPVAASVLVLPSRNYVFKEDVGQKDDGQLYSMSGAEYVLSESQIVKSREVVLRAIEKVGLGVIYPDLGRKMAAGTLPWHRKIEARLNAWTNDQSYESVLTQAVDAYKTKIHELAVSRALKKLTVQTTKDSNVISLGFGHSSPIVARDLLDSLLSAYLERRHELYARKRSELFAIQRDRFNQRLADKEQELAEFKQAANFNAFEEQKNLLIRLQAEIVGDWIDTKTRLSESESKASKITTILNSLPKEVLDSQEKVHQDSAASARTALVSLEMRRNELLTKFKSQSQYIKNIDEQISSLKETIHESQPTIASQEKYIKNPTIVTLESQRAMSQIDVDSLKSRLGALELEKASLERKLHDFDTQESVYDLLTLSRDQLKENLKTYAQKAEEALILEEMERQSFDNVRIVEPPRLPDRKTNYVFVFLGISVLLGPLVASIALLIKHKLRQVFISPEEVEQSLRLPVLVTIPMKTSPSSAIPPKTYAQASKPR